MDRKGFKYGELQKGILNKIVRDLENFKKSPKERLTKTHISGRLDKLNDDEKSAKFYHEAIVGGGCLEEGLKLEDLKVIYDKISDIYLDYKAILMESLEKISTPPPAVKLDDKAYIASVSEGQRSAHSEVRLPRIDLPKFDGSYTTWRPFYDRFQALVHNNKSLTDLDRLHFLQSCLTDDAKRFLHNLSVEAANYEKAWTLLKERYDHKRILVHIQMQQLFGQSPLPRETATGLRNLLYTTKECFIALQNMDVPVEKWDIVLIWFINQKLPSATQKLWEESLGDKKELPKFNEFTSFLEKRFRTLEVFDQKDQSTSNYTKFDPAANAKLRFPLKSKVLLAKQKFKPAKPTVTENLICKLCNKEKHSLKRCQQFLNMDTMGRTDVVRRLKVCENCLSYRHFLNECPSPLCCFFCQQRHHSLLHVNQQVQNNNIQRNPAQSSSRFPTQPRATTSNVVQTTMNANAFEFQPNNDAQNTTTLNYHTSYGDRDFSHQVLLATAIVKARSSDGRLHFLRAMIDTGSESSFITEEAAQLLKLKKLKTCVEVSGLGLVSSGTSQNAVQVQIISCHSPFQTALQAFTFKSLTGLLPTQRMVPDTWKHLIGLPLADPHLHVPAPIDLLLGSDVCAQIFLPEIKRPEDGTGPMAQKTELGWIVLGRVSTHPRQQIRSFFQTTDLNLQLQKFWEMEELPFQVHETEENVACEAHFEKYTRRLANGRYQVKMPFKDDTLPKMGSSRQMAYQRFLHLEKKLEANPTLRADYIKCIKEYETLHHMEQISNDDEVLNTPNHFILPHHAVIKESSTTTKTRVVFDAASKDSNGKSLNDYLLVGPKLQTSIIDLVIRWRTHRYTFTADIEKMYRQILVSHPDCFYQIIMWRENRTEPLKLYKLKTVTFGTASAPYLAIKTLQRLAQDEQDKYPVGAKVVREDMYVDDLISGADSMEEARRKRDEAKELLSSAGFNLRKWTANHRDLIEDTLIQDREYDFELPFDLSNHVKTLGIKWFPSCDFFSYKNAQEPNETTTKRTILSTVAKLFDPLGWISPCIITAKIIMQKLWDHGCDWDEEVPAHIKKSWEAFQLELPIIENVRIPRWNRMSPSNKAIELHGFCDASTKAYGAVVYVRVLDNKGAIHNNILLAKTKIAPSKRTITLPRLELCGAVILAQLLQYTRDVLAIPNVRIFAWTDSTIALAWIRTTPSNWTTFVSNRVSEIQRLIGSDCWSHVPTQHNPADLASRGVYPSIMESLDVWWNGPKFLRSMWEFDVPGQVESVETEEERRPVKIHTIQVAEELTSVIIHRISSLHKVIRVIAWWLRYKTNLRAMSLVKKKSNISNVVVTASKLTGPLRVSELEAARTLAIKTAQSEMFSKELKDMQENNKIPKQLQSLNVFIDTNGIMRVGGRLQNSLLPYEAQHPILLNNSHHFTRLVAKDAHKNTLHGGIQQMIAYIRQRFWIGQIRRSVKYQLHHCTTCYRQKAAEMQQLMGNLPAARVRMARPFCHTGVDYAGPIEIKAWKARGSKILKGYFAVFICLTTKAIHLEVVSDLTTQAFLAAFRRFTARRGICKQIYSDCGTNFVGANTELNKMLKDAQHDFKEIAENLANQGTEWHFIPPASPHFGGLWEAGVKSVKYHLKRIVGTERLTFEELTTLLTQIEACLNSRPLCPLSDSIDDLDVLTPAHFLIGESLHAVPQGEIDINITYMDRWKRIQALMETFWSKWSSEYLSRLQQRPKWMKVQENIKIGDIVLIKDERFPPTHWNLARVHETHPGSDGLIRVVTVKTKSGMIKRPIAKVCRLPSNETLEQQTIV
ncbi:uncharacterized protein LOC129943365 [Eupeodes corollae]|uniref:uncharacterized protein LOC129943365 n=1 Tax=Eupeodes corollae TaxID=290404 RepID=UPI00248FC4BC|nr:uncharacterized protein LOC129943365 [Eupeodes corollae]